MGDILRLNARKKSIEIRAGQSGEQMQWLKIDLISGNGDTTDEISVLDFFGCLIVIMPDRIPSAGEILYPDDERTRSPSVLDPPFALKIDPEEWRQLFIINAEGDGDLTIQGLGPRKIDRCDPDTAAIHHLEICGNRMCTAPLDRPLPADQCRGHRIRVEAGITPDTI